MASHAHLERRGPGNLPEVLESAGSELSLSALLKQRVHKREYFKTCPKNSDEENVPALRLCTYREKLARQIAVDHIP
jgi:hypothetical protein